MDRASLTKQYKQGREIPAAVAQGMEKRLMTSTEIKLSDRALSAPPRTMPSGIELQQIASQMAGWSSGNAPLEDSAAIQVWSLLQMGIAPHNINVLGGKSAYVTVDGRIAHAHRLFEQQGKVFGRIRHIMAPTDEYEIAGGREGKQDLVIKALYEEERTRTVTEGERQYEERYWEIRDWEWGTANGRDTVIKTGKSDQPVEKLYPLKMAKVRATNALLRKVAPVHFPAGVGIQAEPGVVIELDEADYREIGPASEETAEAAPRGDEPAGEASGQAEVAGAPEELEDEGPEAGGPPEGVDEDTGEVEDAVFTELEVNIDQPGSKPRPDLNAMDPLISKQIDGLMVAGYSSESSFASLGWFQWGDDRGHEAVFEMLKQGWDIPQVVELVKAQDKERAVANS